MFSTAALFTLVVLSLLGGIPALGFPQNSTVDQALSFLKLHEPANAALIWRLRRFERSISGTGLHKLLKYDFGIDGERFRSVLTQSPKARVSWASCDRQDSSRSISATVDGSQPQCASDSAISGPLVRESCELALVQPLPAALYADVDELHNLRTSVSYHTKLFGTPDAERTEVECDPTALLVIVKEQTVSIPVAPALMHASPAAQRSVAARGDVTVSISVPVHGRYPAPSFKAAAVSSLSIWQRAERMLSSGSAEVHVAPPILAVHCSTTEEGWQLIEDRSELLQAYPISTTQPAGNRNHQPFVVLCTALSYVLATATILIATLRSSGR